MTFKDKTLLLGVGAAKSGTTWFYQYCKTHPEIGVSIVKELHYFDQIYGDKKVFRKLWKTTLRKRARKLERMKAREVSKPMIEEQSQLVEALKRQVEFLKSDAKTHDKYYDFIEHYVEDCEIFADLTPAYSLLTADQFKEIKSIQEKIKIVFLMRDPVSRFYSQVCMGERTTKNKKGAKGIQAIANFEKILNRPARTARGDYKTIITNLEAAFDPSQIHYEFYENLFTDAGLKNMCEFLGVEFVPGNYSENVNFDPDSKPLPPELAKLARQKFSDIYDFCRDKFDDVPESWMD